MTFASLARRTAASVLAAGGVLLMPILGVSALGAVRLSGATDIRTTLGGAAARHPAADAASSTPVRVELLFGLRSRLWRRNPPHP
jgi:hypothetical protein